MGAQILVYISLHDLLHLRQYQEDAILEMLHAVRIALKEFEDFPQRNQT